MSSAAIIVALGQAWLLAGLCVGAAFLLFGLDRIDASARGAYGFRPLLLPGLVLLWPLVLWRWLALPREAMRSRRHKRAHAVLWTALAIVLPLIIATAVAMRQHDVPRPASQRIGSVGAVSGQ